MNLEELSFFNRQLAGMVSSGIPLEGALERLCGEMARGRLRNEIEALTADLGEGTPLADAIGRRRLPSLYISMVRLAAASGDLSAVLTMLADHYEREAATWAKLRGLMVYPHIVLVVALGASFAMSTMLRGYLDEVILHLGYAPGNIAKYRGEIYVPTVALGVLLVLAVLASLLSGWRHWLRWRAPGFRDASIARVSSAMSVMLRSGCRLDDTLAAVADLEAGTPAEAELRRWRKRHSAGHGAFAAIAEGSAVFPPFFVWVVSSAGEDLASGLTRAAGVYDRRACYRTEVMLYAALPLAILVIGVVILGEAWIFARALTGIQKALYRF